MDILSEIVDTIVSPVTGLVGLAANALSAADNTIQNVISPSQPSDAKSQITTSDNGDEAVAAGAIYDNLVPAATSDTLEAVSKTLVERPDNVVAHSLRKLYNDTLRMLVDAAFDKDTQRDYAFASKQADTEARALDFEARVFDATPDNKDAAKDLLQLAQEMRAIADFFVQAQMDDMNAGIEFGEPLNSDVIRGSSEFEILSNVDHRLPLSSNWLRIFRRRNEYIRLFGKNGFSKRLDDAEAIKQTRVVRHCANVNNEKPWASVESYDFVRIPSSGYCYNLSALATHFSRAAPAKLNSYKVSVRRHGDYGKARKIIRPIWNDQAEHDYLVDRLQSEDREAALALYEKAQLLRPY